MENKTIYITGEARTTLDNAITKIYGSFYLAFVIDSETGEILKADCNTTLELTREFLKELFIGKIIDKDEEAIIEEISSRYFASSSRAIVVAYRDALQRFKKR
ncbi:DUF3870 domain-containing protein [Peptoniphilus raoultii]|uniref:DUF3870 domain-containing protein n=1 Tax=Peptoniphilus raoultii TaxID=1776387 RepID=UPI0008D9F714|nr:DUF3870 domain-containing protein [Peptoniphilus raoultii]